MSGRIFPQFSFSQAALVAVTLSMPVIAPAQRAQDNAVTAASDAFGTTVGSQTVGLYSPSNARGFSPAQAQNLRIDGLYYDQEPTIANMFLFSGSDMRVGISAQTYAFPSPTGIADYKLRSPGDTPLVSGVFIHGPFTNDSAEVDSQYPLIKDVLSAALNVGAAHAADYNFSMKSENRSVGLLFRYTPTPAIELLPFFGYVHSAERSELPLVFATGTDAIPLFEARALPRQSWSSWVGDQTTAGVIGSFAPGDSWRLKAGLFHSVEADKTSLNDLLLAVTSNGMAEHVMDVAPPLQLRSSSADVRLTRLFTQGAHQREIMATVRGRDVRREYGGDSLTDFGPVSLYGQSPLPEPPLEFSEKSVDTVRQTGVGLNYRERWQGVGTLSAGILKTYYSRTVATPGSVGTAESNAPILPSLSFSVDPAKLLTLFGSYTRGLEDSVNAPHSAVNSGELPPATPTWQVDAGVRVAALKSLALVLDAFEIHKTYFNLDDSGRYRQIGTISSRGIEASTSYTDAAGITVVAGAVLLKPEIRLTAQQLGGSGTIPIGPVPATVNVNIDYAPLGWRGVGTSLQWIYLSSRVETADDRIKLPPLSTLNLGLRFSRKLFDRPLLVRLDVINLTNATGLTISPLYQVTPQQVRNYTLTLAIDI
jgi:iron complex outermembrane recepter protein